VLPGAARCSDAAGRAQPPCGAPWRPTLCSLQLSCASPHRGPRWLRAQLAAGIKALLAEAEEAAKAAQLDRASALWDGKMKATQTQSAFGLGVL
jgi:hypothetical protein